jgi:hypothetical protein
MSLGGNWFPSRLERTVADKNGRDQEDVVNSTGEGLTALPSRDRMHSAP